MNRVSRRALVNFIVDSVIAAAFLVSAVSGLVFLAPSGWLSLSGSATTALGVSFAMWRTIHDWAALIMITGVVLHTALHWRWVTVMVRRLTGDGHAQARSEARTGPVSARAVAATAGADARECSPMARDGLGREAVTRHAFLKRAGVVAAAAVAGGLVGRSVAGALLQDGTSTATGASAQESAADAEVASDESGGAWSGNGEGDGQSQQTPTQTARVVVDTGRCTGCGACLQACPYGVFQGSGDTVVAADPDACRLCGRCTQICRAGAITLNG